MSGSLFLLEMVPLSRDDCCVVRWLRPLARPNLVVHIGFRDDVAALLPSLDCLVNPSLTEDVARAVVEAIHCGVPVVATAVGGIPEILRDGETGLLVRPHRPAELAAAVDGLIDAPERRHALARAARAWACTHLTVERAGRETIAAYQNVLAATAGEVAPAE